MAPYAFDSENSTKWQAVWTSVFCSAIGAVLVVVMVALCGCCDDDEKKKKKRLTTTVVAVENPPEPTPAPPPMVSTIELVDQPTEPPPAPELELQKSMVETSEYWVAQAQGAPSFAMTSWIKKVEVEPGYNLIQPKKKPDDEPRSKTFKSHQPPTVSMDPQKEKPIWIVPSPTPPAKTLEDDKTMWIPSVPKKMPPYTPTPSRGRTTSVRPSFVRTWTRNRSPPRQQSDSPSSTGSLESSRSVQLDKTPIVLGQGTPLKPIQQRNQRTTSLLHSEAINLDSTTADQLNNSISVAGDWDMFNQSRSVSINQTESKPLKSTKQRPAPKQTQTTTIRARKPKPKPRSRPHEP